MGLLDEPADDGGPDIEDFCAWVTKHAARLSTKYMDYVMSNPDMKIYPYHYSEWVLNQFKLCQLFPETSP